MIEKQRFKMNLSLCLSLFLWAFVTGELIKKSPRMLSVFSVVSFPNEECPTETATTAGINGICITSSECSDRNGEASVNCASGFGVCCIIRVTTCGSTIPSDQNITFIQNVGFPTAFTTASTPCAYNIAANKDICQIRLDFLTGEFSDTDPTNGCNQDVVSFGSPAGNLPPNICGQLTGQHVYLETAGQGATLNVNTGTGVNARRWNIKVSQIECESPNRAPSDCAQYFTENSGIVQSFNFPNGMIPNSQYNICLRRNNGFCSFSLTESGTVPDAFALSAPATSIIGDACKTAGTGNQAYIQVQSQNVKTDRFCGKILSADNANVSPGEIISTAIPFRIGVTAINMIQQADGGFNLMFTQRPCGAV